MSQVIEVIVSPTGQVRVETKGFFGSECRSASASLERALGLRQIEQLTPAFHQTSQAQTNTQVQ